MQLASKKYRDMYGLYVIEGNNLINEAAKMQIDLESVFIRKDYEISDDFKWRDAYILSGQLFDKIAGTVTSQGIIAIVKKPVYSAAEFFKIIGDGNIVVLDRLQDPGNIGTIIRTADAAGYKGVMILKGTGDVYSPKVVRAAAGSLFRLPLLFIDTTAAAIKAINGVGKKITASCPEGDVCYHEADLSKNVALLIGNEGSGISLEFAESECLKIRIPMTTAVDSLNAAVAAGILMYENVRKEEKCIVG